MALLGNSDTQLDIVVRLRDEASRQIAAVQASLGGLNSRLRAAEDASKAFSLGVTGALAAVGAIGAVGIKTAADLETARAGMITLLGSAEAADKTLTRLKVEAARTPFELPGLVQATQLLSSVTKDGDKSIDILLNIGEGLAAMGKGQSELDRIIVNLQQIAAVGRAGMIDIRQFAFAGIPIFEMLTEQTGLAGEALEDFISDGGVTFEMLTSMFDKANDAGGRFFNAFANQGGTFNQVLSNMKDTLNIFLADLVKSTGIFDGVKKAMAAFNTWLNENKDSIRDAIVWLGKHKEILAAVAGAILGGMVPALYALVAALAAAVPLLGPFMAIGALVGILAAIALNAGGLRDQLMALMQVFDEKTGLITLFQWAWQQIVTTWNENLKPALGELWTAITDLFAALQPLEPVLMLIAKVAGGALLVAIYGITLAITGWIQVITAIISLATEFAAAVVRNFTQPIKDFTTAVRDAYDWVVKLIKKASEIGGSVGSKVKGGISKVGDLLGFEHGGTVPGPVGTPVPIIAHGQETILPANQKGPVGNTINVEIYNPSVRSNDDITEMRRQMEQVFRGILQNNKVSGLSYS